MKLIKIGINSALSFLLLSSISLGANALVLNGQTCKKIECTCGPAGGGVCGANDKFRSSELSENNSDGQVAICNTTCGQNENRQSCWAPNTCYEAYPAPSK